MLQLTVATQPLREATVSQLLNVRELTALNSKSELELLPEKQLVSVPSAMVSLVLPSISEHVSLSTLLSQLGCSLI